MFEQDTEHISEAEWFINSIKCKDAETNQEFEQDFFGEDQEFESSMQEYLEAKGMSQEILIFILKYREFIRLSSSQKAISTLATLLK